MGNASMLCRMAQESDTTTRVTAIHALATVQEAASSCASDLIRMLKEDNPTVRAAAEPTLVQFRSEAVLFLKGVEGWQDEELREADRRILAKIEGH